MALPRLYWQSLYKYRLFMRSRLVKVSSKGVFGLWRWLSEQNAYGTRNSVQTPSINRISQDVGGRDWAPEPFPALLELQWPALIVKVTLSTINIESSFWDVCKFLFLLFVFVFVYFVLFLRQSFSVYHWLSWNTLLTTLALNLQRSFCHWIPFWYWVIFHFYNHLLWCWGLNAMYVC